VRPRESETSAEKVRVKGESEREKRDCNSSDLLVPTRGNILKNMKGFVHLHLRELFKAIMHGS
jgi:hypothetical protein